MKTLSEKFESALSEIEVEHNFEFGNEFEIAICKVLRRILPRDFGICRGYVVNKEGKQAGDDIIIYDQSRFPTLRSLVQDRFEQKERIPIEAGYAYIEAKHTLYLDGASGQSLEKALQQVDDVKALCKGRLPLSPQSVVPYLTFPTDFVVQYPKGWPDIKNPMFTAIIARRVISVGGTVDAARLSGALPFNHWKSKDANPPDLIIAGSDLVGFPLLYEDSGAWDAIPLMTPGRTKFAIGETAGIAFGRGLACLLYALDWIELRKMPWDLIMMDDGDWTPNKSSP
ncbi:MAG TPA: DUF6602 domain-containing protein [Verrucomicrobiales bacterium]|nr:DUF6602 domain-containing protein [Verrucomicrobiales bacterium]